MLLSEAIEQYLFCIRYERGFSDRTFLTYQSWSRHYARWLTGHGYPNPTIDQLSPAILRRFLVYLTDVRGQRPKSIHSSFHAIRGLCAYLTETGLLAVDPAKAIRLPKLDSPYRKMVTDEEVEAILEACERLPTSHEVALARGVFSVLAYTGLRRAELCDLKVDDFSAEDGSITVRRGKGGKSRKVYPNQACLDAVREWLITRGACDHDWLWAHNKRWRLAFNGLHGLLTRVKAAAGLRDAKHIQPHSFRHGCATRLMLNGANLMSIKDHLGHTCIETTAKYLHSDELSLRELADLGALRTRTGRADARTPGR